MSDQTPSGSTNPFDALIPAEVARKAEAIGVVKASQPAWRQLALSLLGGVFISFGAIFFVILTTPSTDVALPYGLAQLLGGVVFSLGLVLVLLSGAELFTGNNIIIMARASGKISTRQLLRNWGIVYVGNVVASIGIAYVVHLSGHLDNGGGAVRARTIAVAAAKTSNSVGQAVTLGVLANVLVCLAVWLCLAAHSVTDKVVAIVGPVSLFVAAGFEHSIANTYLIPVALFAGGESDTLTWSRFVTHNLAPVTIGNMIGGAVLVGLTYWVIYLRVDSRV